MSLKTYRSLSGSETTIQRQILDYLERKHIFAWRNNVGQRPGASGRPVRFGYPGSSDILGITKGGRFLAIEVKKKKGVRGPLQIKFQGKVQASGGIAIFAESVEDVMKII